MLDDYDGKIKRYVSTIHERGNFQAVAEHLLRELASLAWDCSIDPAEVHCLAEAGITKADLYE